MMKDASVLEEESGTAALKLCWFPFSVKHKFQQLIGCYACKKGALSTYYLTVSHSAKHHLKGLMHLKQTNKQDFF